MKYIIFAVISAFMFSGCITPSSVDAGEEAVLVKKPWFFGHGGVDPEPEKTGLVWTAFSTEVIRINVKPFNITEPFDDLITYDNNPVDFDIHLTFKHIEGKTPILVEKFGNDWYQNKVREPLKNSVREFTKNNTMFQMTTDPNVITKLENVVTTEVQKFLKDEGIPTELAKVTVGKVSPPQAVIDSTIQTAVQKQNVKTQEERVKAEQSRELAEKAAANADRAYMQAINMNAEQYLKMKELDNQKLAIEKGSNVNIIMGSGIPLIQAK
jgi:regulator of protease activity HflC (stomatin/prohibitin superfamily)